MNRKQCLFVIVLVMRTIRGMSETSGMESFIQTLALSDVVGIGTYRSGDHEGDRIDNITYWTGDPGTNSVLLTPIEWLDGGLFSREVNTNDTVVFWGMRLGWKPSSSNEVILSDSSAWTWRKILTRAGSAGQIPSSPFRIPGDWINVTTSSPATISFISNVVYSLCVSPDLTQYGRSLIPPLDVGWEDNLSVFKADAHLELLKLEWGENEDFLVQVLNNSQYPRKFRGGALFELKKRFGWPATNTVPEP